MATRRDPRLFMLIVVLLFVINSPDPQPQSYNARSRFAEVIDEEWHALGILNTTRYTDFDPGKDKWLNITGLREADRYAWDLLDPVQQLARKQTERLLGNEVDKAIQEHPPPLYRNLSGFVQGEWVRSSLGRIRHPSDLNTTAIYPDTLFPSAEYERNLTGAGGSIRLHLSEREGQAQTDPNRTISEVSARMIIEDDTTVGKWWEFRFERCPLHRIWDGDSNYHKFAGIFGLPHFITSEHHYTQSQKLLNWTLAKTIEHQSNRAFPIWNPWTSAPDGSSDIATSNHNCEYIIYLQAHPVQFFPVPDKPPNMEWIEHEMRFPTGFPLPHRSPLAISMVGFSPDCGFVVESKGPRMNAPEELHLVGSKMEEYVNRGRKGIITFAAALTLQLLLLIRQMKETATPSTRNRVSFYTIAMFAVGDGFSCLSLIFLHLVLNSSALPLYATAFLALFSVIFQLRFLMDVWTVQATEQIRQERERGSTAPPQNPEPTTRPTESTASSDSLPLPVTTGPAANTRRPTPPIIIPSDQDDPDPDDDDDTPAGGATPNTPQRAELGTLYTRYCLFLLFIFFLTIHSTSMWTVFRTIYFNTLCFFYLSFWCPQIYRNIMRNCRKALRWDFVIGQSVLRLVPIAYFYAVGDNILFSRADMKSLGVLVVWIWVQILALISQEVLGSRFFIREGWAPPAYDYHPILREDEENATMPIGPISSPISTSPDSSHKPGPGEARTKGKMVFDCSICAQDIEVPVVPSGASTAENAASGGIGGMFLTRRQYMVTPCRHIFHTQCLEGWMRYRLACPNCREILPPL